jgi:hypothetical protein
MKEKTMTSDKSRYWEIEYVTPVKVKVDFKTPLTKAEADAAFTNRDFDYDVVDTEFLGYHHVSIEPIWEKTND